MRKITVNLLFFIFSFLFFHQAVFSSMTERLDAKVVGSDPNKKTLTVQFEHPATNELVEKQFVISDSTRFKRAKDITRVKNGDLVTIDYRNESGKAIATYVDVVPVDRQVVSPGQLASSLAKIKR